MRRRADPEIALHEYVELWSAATADELHQVLVLHAPALRTADADLPLALLRRLHAVEPAASVVTAMLLLTDLRWRDGISHLVRRIEASGILPPDQLDLLAQTFLVADDAVYWKVPEAWFDETFVIEFDHDEATDGEPPTADGPAVARRQIVPPLRRWAATRRVTQAPEAWSALLARAREVNARNAAAIMAGLLDGFDSLPPPVQALLVQQAIRWPEHAVRRLGLGLLADREGPQAAHAVAKNDPNQRIRAWADSLLIPPPARHPTRGGTTPPAQTERPEPPPTLF